MQRTTIPACLLSTAFKSSTSRKGNPYDNARTESFMKTLKYEEVYRQEYRDLADALRSLRHFLEKVYNEKTAALVFRLFATG